MAHTADDMHDDEPTPVRQQEPASEPHTVVSKEAIQRATEGALAFWRSCQRHDLDEEAKVKGALVKYQMSLDAVAAIEKLRAEAAENQSSRLQTSLWHWREEVGKLHSKVARLESENTRLRAALAQSDQPCAYCTLPAEDWGKCEHGFPGCSRADDAVGCPELGASMRAEAALAPFVRWLEGLEADGFGDHPDDTICGGLGDVGGPITFGHLRAARAATAKK